MVDKDDPDAIDVGLIHFLQVLQQEQCAGVLRMSSKWPINMNKKLRLDPISY